MSNKKTTYLEGDLYISTSLEPSIYGNGSTTIEGDLLVNGSATVIGGVSSFHSALLGLLNDDHTQYTLLAGRSGGQILTGGTASGNNLTIRSSSNATKGSIILDETTATTSSVTGALRLAGGLGISNTTDATSSTNGGTITTAGGVAIAKKLFVGTDLSVGGIITAGTWNGSTITVPFGGTGATTLTNTGVLVGAGASAISAGSGITYASNTLVLPKITSNDTTASTSSASGSILVAGGISISNLTDATSVSNGGTITTAGGVAIAKKLFVGTDLSIGGTITSGTWNGSTITVPFGGTGATTLASTGVLLGNGTGAISAGSGITYASNILTLPNITSNGSTATTSNTTGSILVAGGIGISNTTDATSATNGGTITTAGGVAIAKKLFVAGIASFSGTLNMNSGLINNVATPVSGTDAANKNYVDLAVQGLDAKQSVVVATTVAGTLVSSFANGSVVDGITLATGNRILIKDQASAIENGVYTVNASGAPSRSTDFNTGASVAGSFIFVESGTVNDNSGWTCSNTSGTDVVGTNSITFVQFSGAGSIIAGTGLTKTGNTLSVNASQTQITAIGTITSGTWNATTITVPFGGTGATTLTTNGVLVGAGTGAVSAGTGITYASNVLTLPRITSNDTTASTSNTLGSILVAGGIGISNTTDAISATNGGTITTAGGVAIAKKLFVGTDLNIGGNLTITGTAALPHGNLTGLGNDDHTQYALLAGRSSGQVITGGTGSGENITIRSTVNATKGSVILDETTATTSNASGSLRLAGGIGISNTTDAISALNGGTITTAGGVGIAKKLFVGTDLSVGGTITSGIWNGNVISVAFGGTGANTFTSTGVLLGNGTGAISAGSGITYASNILTLPNITSNSSTATTSNTTGSILVAGGIGISNTTDATSSASGGTITTAGGVAIAKKLFVGTDLSVGGIITAGTWNGSTITVPFGGTGATTLTSTGVLLGNGTGAISAGSGITYASNILTLPNITSNGSTATTSSASGSVLVAGGIGISNTTDAISATNGGTITTAGGVAIAKKLFVAGGVSFSNTLNMNNTTINNVATPVSGTDAANKNYVDLAVQGLDAKQSVVVATTVAGTLASSYANGSVVDGITLVTGFRILIKDQASAIENGVYTVNASGAPTRSTDFNTGASVAGSFIFVESGTVNDNSGWTCSNTSGTDVVGTNSIVFVQFSGAGSIIAGTGLTKTGNTLSVNASQTQITAIGTITSGTWNGTTIAVANGGTGATTLTTNGVLVGAGIGAISAGTGITYASNVLTLPSITSNSTTATTSNTTGSILMSGGIGISNTTDATSSTNGGTITTAGGVAIAKKLFVGTDLSVTGIITAGTWNGGVISVPFGGTGATTLTSTGVLLGNGTGAVSAGSGITYASNILTLPNITSNSTTATTSNTTGSILVAGGVGISNTTDATSSTNGGTITTAGGVAIAKKLFVGTDVNIGGNLTITGTATLPHGNLTGLSNDDHTQYLLLAGRSGGQILTGGTASGNNLTIRSTSNVTKGSVILDETTATTSNTTGSILVAGGIGISNTTDAISSVSGGTITTAGGVAIAKKLFVGTDLSVGGIITSGTWNGSAITVAFGGTGATTFTSTGVLLGNGTGAISAGSGITYASSILTLPNITSNGSTATTSNTTGSILVAGGIGISNTTDAISSASGGTITTAGGVAIAKKLFVGTDLSIGGIITSGTWNGSAISVAFGGTGATTFTSTGVLLGNGTGAISAGSGITYASNILTLPNITSNGSTATTSNTTGSILVAGGIGISNTTDAISSSNGGTITTAGGVAIAKKLFVGTDLSIGGIITSGTWNGSAITVAFGGTGATTLTSTGVLLGNGTGAISAGSGITYASNILTLPNITSNGSTATTSSASGSILVAGGIGISNTTDATSATNGGTITTAGGVAIAKKLFVAGIVSITNTLNMNSNLINNVATPVSGTDAANKNYVDLAVQGLDAKQSVIVATTVAGTLASSFANGSVVDGITLATGNRILIKDQASAIENGVYTVNASGAPTRSTDFNTGASVAGSFIFVESGTVNDNSGWTCSNTSGTDVVGTNSIVFVQFSGAGSIIAGTGLTKTGNTLSVNASQTQITAIGTITSGTWNGTTIAVANGGTGATTLTTNGVLIGAGTSAISAGTGITYASNVLTLPRITSNDTTASTSNTLGSVLLSGGLSISNTTEAISATNGGTITTAGGVGIAKKLFVGTDLSVGGIITSGTWNGTTIAVANGGTGATTFTSTAVLLGNGSGAISAGSGITYASNVLTLPNITSNSTTATTSSATGSILVAGGIGISNTTDATSFTNGGTITTAGGVAIAKKLFVGSDVSIGGALTVSGSFAIPHGNLTGLTSGDDHTQYLLSAGRIGGQIITGGTASGNNYTIRSTTNATKGSVILDETTATTSNISGALRLAGGLGISNTTDATSITNGGTITTAGGVSIAKKLYVGTTVETGNILVTNSVANSITINCQGSAVNPGRLIFSNTAGTGDFRIYGDGGDVQWLGGGGRAQILGSYHEIRLLGGRITTGEIPMLNGSNDTFNTIIQNSSNSIGLRIQANGTQTANLSQWVNSTGATIYSFVDSVGVFNLAGLTVNSFFQQLATTAPSNPAGGSIRYYTDSSDSLFKSRNGSGVVTIYQPANTKGDLVTHNGTTQVRLPVGGDGDILVSDSTATPGLSWFTKIYADISEQQTAGTNGGTATSGSFFTRTLNTAVYKPASQTAISLAANTISLEPGVYKISGSVPAFRVGVNTCRVRDITNNVVLALGSSENAVNNANSASTRSLFNEIITVASAIDIVIEHRVTTTTNTNGRGVATGFQTEVYTQVFIETI